MERLDLATWLRTRGQLDVPAALAVVDQLAAELDSAQASHAEIRPDQVLVGGLDGGGPVTAGLSGSPRPGPDSTPLALAALLRAIVVPGAAAGAERLVASARAGAYADAAATARAARVEVTTASTTASTGRPAALDMRETRVVSIDDARRAEPPAAAPSGRDHRETRVMSVGTGADTAAAPSETFVRPVDDAPVADTSAGAGVPAHSETIVRPSGGSSAPAHSETMARPTGTPQPAHSETMSRPAGAPDTDPPSPSGTMARPTDRAGAGQAAVAAGPAAAGSAAATDPPAEDAAVDPSVTRTPSWSSSTTRSAAPPPAGRRRRRGRGAVWVVLLVVVAALVWWFWPFQSAGLVQVTGATVTPGEASGCDVTVRVVGTIRTNGAGGDITYQWLRSDGTTSPPMTQTVENGRPSVDVPLLWTVSGPGRFTGTATLKVLQPNPTQAEGRFTYDCR